MPADDTIQVQDTEWREHENTAPMRGGSRKRGSERKRHRILHKKLRLGSEFQTGVTNIACNGEVTGHTHLEEFYIQKIDVWYDRR